MDKASGDGLLMILKAVVLSVAAVAIHKAFEGVAYPSDEDLKKAQVIQKALERYCENGTLEGVEPPLFTNYARWDSWKLVCSRRGNEIALYKLAEVDCGEYGCVPGRGVSLTLTFNGEKLEQINSIGIVPEARAVAEKWDGLVMAGGYGEEAKIVGCSEALSGKSGFAKSLADGCSLLVLSRPRNRDDARREMLEE